MGPNLDCDSDSLSVALVSKSKKPEYTFQQSYKPWVWRFYIKLKLTTKA